MSISVARIMSVALDLLALSKRKISSHLDWFHSRRV